ncbi:MAG: hypothetical protein WCA84_02500 [Ignavibacteriaceae bacterium]
MNKFYAVIIIIIIASVNSLPQESSYYDAPLGGGIGYVPGWIIPKVDGINAQFKIFGVPELPQNGLFTSGGAGFIYLGILENFRIGGFGFGGSKSSSANYFSNELSQSISESGTEQSEAVYSLSGGGLSFEYTLPFMKNIAMSLGVLAGRGSLSIELYRNYGNINWQSFWQNTQSGYQSASSSLLKDTYWIFSPTLNVEIPVYHMLCFRIGGGYNITFGDVWTYDNNQGILNAPSGINGNSFFIQTGIFVGLFSF